jgi:uncharacterized protein (TIGR01777 family)
MNYLITGGTGLIGKAVIAALLKNNETITVLTRDINKASKVLGSQVVLIDSLSLATIEATDVIINLAGESIAAKRWSTAQKHKICHSRWDITQKLVDLIKQVKTPPSLLISGSAIGIYGRQSEAPIDENFTQYHPEFTHTICEKWERIALDAQSLETRVVVLRTGIVLANNDGALAKMLLPFKLGLGGKMGSGKQMMSWIHIDDMVAAIMHIEQTECLKGAINLTAENAVTNEEFTTTLAKTLKRPSFFPMPSFVVKVLFGEMSDILLLGQNVVPSKLKDSGFSFSRPTLAIALASLFSND